MVMERQLNSHPLVHTVIYDLINGYINIYSGVHKCLDIDKVIILAVCHCILELKLNELKFS